MRGNLPLFCVILRFHAGGFASADATRGQRKQTNVCDRPLDPLRVHTPVTWIFIGSFYFGCPFTAQSCRSAQPGNRPLLFPARNCSGGGSPEGAEIPALYLFSPLWALFGYFLARQKVTTSPPQRRREQRQKSRKKKQTHHAQKQGKINREECKTSFSALPIATARRVCYNNHAQNCAKEGVFNAEQ